jgi:hypothetical protein
VVVPGRIVPAIIGFGLVSLGLGPVGPIIQSVTTRTAHASHKVLRMRIVTTAGYLGLISGQPLIGGIASLTSLRLSLGIIGPIALFVLALSSTMREHGERTHTGRK